MIRRASRSFGAAALAAALALPALAHAQPVSIERGVRAGKLWCFPLSTDSSTFVYVPGGARLANDERGRAQFSFVRYVVNTVGDSAGASSVTEARGGGVLHFLVELDTPAADVKDAEAALRESTGNDRAVVRGPILLDDGRYLLVSSILQPGEASERTHVLATGRAPVLEGNRLALSFDLDPQRATLLMRSFEMSTPDVSLVFDLSFSGLSDAYDAELTVDWAQVRKSAAFKAGGSAYFCSADIDVAFDDLRRNQAIQLRTAGNHPATEGLVSNVYAKVLDLLFKPVEPERVPESQKGGLFDALAGMFGRGGLLSSRKLTGFGAELAYQLRDVKSEGRSVMTFHSRSLVQRHALVTFNLGDFPQRFGNDPDHFRTVNLGDPAFQQREVQVGLDGALLPELSNAINNITVTLRKSHANGEQTVREVVLDGSNAKSAPGQLRMVYGWNGDADRLAWLGYEYRTRWSFRGGGVYETPWRRSEAPMIDLFAPYERRTVQFAGDPAALKARGVRAVVVEVAYPFFGEQRRPQIVLRPGDPIDEKRVEITLPLGQPQYDVTLTWQLEGSQRLQATRHESSGLVFVDEFP